MRRLLELPNVLSRILDNFAVALVVVTVGAWYLAHVVQAHLP